VATAHIGSTGVDETVAAVVTHAGGMHSVAKASIRTPLPCTATIAGEDGFITLPAPMHHPDHFTITSGAGARTVDTPFSGNGLRFQVAEVHARLAAGELQSAVMPWDDTLRLSELMDDVKRAIGLRYDADEQ
jgi:hypothetical protein